MHRNTNERRVSGERRDIRGDRASLYDEVTGRIIADLEAGQLPWVRPWRADGSGVGPGLPRNALTGRPYSGINILILWGEVITRGYPSQGWLTFRQALAAGALREPLVGRVIHRGFSDEHRDRHYMMIDGVDGRVHYVDIGRGDATPSVPEGATVRIEPTKAAASEADRTVDAVARANGGRYSVDLHLRHDPGASEAFPTSHVRRLEAMRRAGAGPERQADGSWSIPEDHLARAEAFARRQQRDRPVALSILSSRQVGDLPTVEAPTWIDRELATGVGTLLRDAGFGREVRTAMAARRQWLIEQQLATGEGREFQLRNGALDELGRREMRDAGGRLAQQFGKPFEPAQNGDRIEGVIARRVDLESGSYAIVERSRDFTLVPWRDVLERNIGKAASGIMRADGISWQFGRGRSGPTIS